MKTKKRAISLIVLVVTIIVLAILAATVIVSITNAGIINKATDTVKNYGLAEVRNMANLIWAEALMDSSITTDTEYDTYVKEHLTNAGVNVSDYEITASAGGITVEEKTAEEWEANVTASTKNVIFTKADGVTSGDPDNLEQGDIVIYGDYEYRYNMQREKNVNEDVFYWLRSTYFDEGWAVVLKEDSVTKSSVGNICTTLYGKSVVSATAAFVGSNISKMPDIPPTLEYMDYTFLNCTNLVEVSELPDTVTSMMGTFKNCTSLTAVPAIPSEVTDLSYTYEGCSNLLVAPEIPDGVTYMIYTFSGCASLEEAPTIPELVGYMEGVFANCTDLTGTVLIKSEVVGSLAVSADETGFDDTFLNITSSLTVKVPEDSMTHEKLDISYRDVSNITIETFAVEE